MPEKVVETRVKKKEKEVDEILLEKTEWFMEKIKKQVNNKLKKWKLPIRIMRIGKEKERYYMWVEQKRKPNTGKEIKYKDEGYKRGSYKYLGMNFTWKEIKVFNKKKRKFNPKRGWIFSFTGKKLSRYNRELQKLYRVRKSIKKIMRDKKRTEEKTKKLIVDVLCFFLLDKLKYSVKKDGKFYWVRILDVLEKAELKELRGMLGRIEGVVKRSVGMEKEKEKWLKEIRKAEKKVEKVIEERIKIQKRVGGKLHKISERISFLDKLYYPKPGEVVIENNPVLK